MTADDLRAWQKRQGYTYDTAAEALGMSRATFARYLKDPGELPRWLALACAALAAGIEPWGAASQAAAAKAAGTRIVNTHRSNFALQRTASPAASGAQLGDAS